MNLNSRNIQLSKIFNGLAIGIFAAAVVAGCREVENHRQKLNAVDYKGNMRLSLVHPVPGYSNRLYLVASAPKNIASIAFCVGNDPQKCVPGVASYTDGRLLKVDKPRNYFAFNNVIEISAGSQIVLVGRDGSGAVIDSRAVEFAPTNGSTVNPSTSPSPTPSSSPSAVPVRASKGSGGPTGSIQVVNFTDSAGLSSTYKVNAPTDSVSKVYGLHIHLHGDGGGGYQDFPNKEVRDDLIGVAVKAPNQGLAWGRQSGQVHARFLNEVIQNDLVKKYNVDLDRIYFSGVSGGSYFLAGHFIPLHGAEYKTGAFLMCGGMAPQVQFVGADFLRNFRIHWEVTAGERPDITASVRQGIAGYESQLKQLGVATNTIMTSTFEGSGEHCFFDGRSYTTGIQFMMDKKFSSIIKPKT